MRARLLILCGVSMFLALSPAAHASRARLLVMGQANPLGINPRGSLYYEDNHNIFYNPAYLNDFRNWVTIEKTNGSTGAEGGFFGSLGTLSFGAYLNRGDAIVTGTGNTGPTNIYTNGNAFKPVDLVAAMDLGFKVGIGVTFGGFRNNETNSQDLTLRAGAVAGPFEPYLDAKVLGEGRTAGQDFKNKNLGLGLRARLGELTPFVVYRHYWYGYPGRDLGDTGFGFGLVRNILLLEQVRFNIATSFWRDTNSDHNVVPIDFSVEGTPYQWLVLRAGLGYRLWDRIANISQAEPTSGRIGASLLISKLSLDWSIGHISNGEVADGRAFDLANGFFTAASMTYGW